VFHSDNGREFKNQSLAKFFEENGILHQTSCTYTPQQNGTAERKNRHILEVARALCFAMHVPKRFWADAVMTATFLINRMPARAIDYQTPFRMLSQFYSIPSALNICPRIFGCVCYIHVHSHQRDKLDPRALKCVFLGYSDSQKGYKCG
jgi:transposase InsO family protein